MLNMILQGIHHIGGGGGGGVEGGICIEERQTQSGVNAPSTYKYRMTIRPV